ncbi:sensor histidine kinase [Streptomyces tsukubensis]|uniref:histidine kinase n=1 Tax=Streptomyces tsukubensis TaxID=83656 RepID=A0A1V4A4Z2_9ACTN|nr:histidine kinase [Streptomyces tsukubensis]OON75133.1 two-component sensor histidine kinase [Streptomyces tsukubensis]QFR96120.1 sensor histidine kinase [Streptomyces tsukubensis]
MTENSWVVWPSREALQRPPERWSGRNRLRTSRLVRGVVFAGLLWGTVTDNRHGGALVVAVGVVCVLAGAALAWGFFRTTAQHRLWPSLGLLTALGTVALLGELGGWRVLAVTAWCGGAVVALERLPLAAAGPYSLVLLVAFGILNNDNWLTTTVIAIGLALTGYVLRLDGEARAATQRLLARERAANAAEAETAALAERARIAREIHDVLAHSLSAQLVHLEAARIQIERGAERDEILERVVAARAMAREGLAETRQALSALRGDMAPVADVLRSLADGEGARLEVRGAARPLPAEAAQTVRRVAQEAFTNIRKHAPDSEVTVRLVYEPDFCLLVVRNTDAVAGRPDLAVSGGGYGLLGMRERAELLGGTLEAGADEEGFTVTLRVPA